MGKEGLDNPLRRTDEHTNTPAPSELCVGQEGVDDAVYKRDVGSWQEQAQGDKEEKVTLRSKRRWEGPEFWL